MTGIDYGSGSEFHAPVMRIDDQGHGFVGVVYDATTRQATDFDTGKKKWFRDRQLVLADEGRDGDSPVPEYIFHVACEKGKGAFTRRDGDGEAVKLSSGKNAVDVRDIEGEDIAIVAGSAWMARAVKSVKLNAGHKVRFKRTTPARDESGDRMTKVECEIEIVGTVDDPKPHKAPVAAVAGEMYDDVGDAF